MRIVLILCLAIPLALGIGMGIGGCLDVSLECVADAECQGGSVCVGGSCLARGTHCGSDADCAADERCAAGLCLFPGRCIEDEQCETDEHCLAGNCVPTPCDDASCPDGQVCRQGECAPPPCKTDVDCEPELVCDLLDHVCKPPAEIPTPELCNEIDDDLDGQIDEGFELGQPCTRGVGECVAHGERVCDDDGQGSHCNAEPLAPIVELCNGLDDDCDEEIDEPFTDLGLACVSGVGACQAVGERVCDGDGSTTACEAVMPEPTSEICDGVDNDCDGLIDEDFSELGEPCVGGVDPCLYMGWWLCVDAEQVCVPGIDPYPYPDGCP